MFTIMLLIECDGTIWTICSNNSLTINCCVNIRKFMKYTECWTSLSMRSINMLSIPLKALILNGFKSQYNGLTFRCGKEGFLCLFPTKKNMRKKPSSDSWAKFHRKPFSIKHKRVYIFPLKYFVLLIVD